MPSEETCLKAVKDLLSFENNLGERDWQAWVKLLKGKNLINLYSSFLISK